MAQQDDYIRTALRVPPDLHAALHAAAKGANRTFNAEIVARLQRTFEPVSSPSSFRSLVERLVTEEKRSFTEGGLTLNLTVTIEPDGAAEAELSRTLTPAKSAAKASAPKKA